MTAYLQLLDVCQFTLS